MPLVATIIANPDNPVIDDAMSNRSAAALGQSDVTWLAQGIACDIDIPDEMPAGKAAETLRNLLAGLPVDVAVQGKAGRKKRALIADMDSTMIEQECIDELAEEAGFRDEVANITARAMNGELEFEPALRERVALLRGLPVGIIEKVLAERITLAPGGRELVATMRASGAHAALVSGGFTLFTGPVSERLGFDEHQANLLEVENGQLTGRVVEPILGRQAKLAALLRICDELGLATADFIAVGDGANDLAMLEVAGTGVALHAKASVAAQAEFRIDHGDLTALLYLQGYRADEFAG